MIKSQLGGMTLGRNDYIWGLLSFFLFFSFFFNSLQHPVFQHFNPLPKKKILLFLLYE